MLNIDVESGQDGDLQTFTISSGLGHSLPMKVGELIKQVESAGWRQVRRKGSHRQFRHPDKAGIVTIAGKLSVDVPVGTANNVLKQAGLR